MTLSSRVHMVTTQHRLFFVYILFYLLNITILHACYFYFPWYLNKKALFILIHHIFKCIIWFWYVVCFYQQIPYALPRSAVNLQLIYLWGIVLTFNLSLWIHVFVIIYCIFFLSENVARLSNYSIIDSCIWLCRY